MTVIPRSMSQVAAYQGGRLPPVEELAPGVLAIPSPMEGSNLHYSLTYAIQGTNTDLHLIDTGLGSDLHWRVLQDNLATLGSRVEDVSTVTLTHLHRDHAGLAAKIRAVSGATIRMHSSDALAVKTQSCYVDPQWRDDLLKEWGVPAAARESLVTAASRRVAGETDLVVDEELENDQSILAGDVELRVLHTPGHTRGHIVILHDDARLAFTGDHLLPMLHSGVGLGGWHRDDNPIEDYVESLDRVSAFDQYEACPGHGYHFAGIEARASASRSHLLHRGEEIRAIVHSDPSLTTWQVASRVSWSAGWENLRDSHLLSALLQTAWHQRLGRQPPRYTT